MQENTSLSPFLVDKTFSLTIIQTAKRVIKKPCPASPNITANKKGNVIIVKGARKGERKKRLLRVKFFEIKLKHFMKYFTFTQ